MNPQVVCSLSPLSILTSMVKHHQLIYSLVKRDVLGRYRGSTMGLAWSFLNPLLMLAVYTFVFGIVFQSHWMGGTDSKAEFALVIFSGLIIFNLFLECINRSPQLILSHVNYVKKVIFPLEILSVVAFGSAFFNFVLSLLVWLIFYFIFFGVTPLTILLLPVIILPLVFFILGFSWLLASLGVYLRDTTHITVFVTSMLMFLSPIFYSIQAIPEKYQIYIQFNPLALIIEQTRDAMIWGKGPNWGCWGIELMASLLIAWLGYVWFQLTRKSFADVI